MEVIMKQAIREVLPTAKALGISIKELITMFNQIQEEYGNTNKKKSL